MNHIKLAYANHFLVGLTVSRIITEHERAHLPAFVNDVSTLYIFFSVQVSQLYTHIIPFLTGG